MHSNRPAADAEVLFKLLPTMTGGRQTPAGTGYRPLYKLRDDYLTSVEHIFIDREAVKPGEEIVAHVWFITPEAYPHSLWVGRRIAVCEGSRVIGEACIRAVFNPLLQLGGA